MARVELELTALPAHVRTARLVVVAAARRAGLADELVDELRLAVGEATSRAVGLHRAHAPDAPVQVAITDDPRLLTVSVSDSGPAADVSRQDVDASAWTDAEDSEEHVDPDVALAMLGGLVDDIDVEAGDSGTTVTLRWPLPARGGPVGLPSTAAAT